MTRPERHQSPHNFRAVRTRGIRLFVILLVLLELLGNHGEAQAEQSGERAPLPVTAASRTNIPEHQAIIDIALTLLDRATREQDPLLKLGQSDAGSSASLKLGRRLWSPAELKPLFQRFQQIAAVDDARTTKTLGLFRSTIATEHMLAERAMIEGLDRDPEFQTFLEASRQTMLAEFYLRRRVIDGITVSSQEIESYYREHPEEFRMPAEVTLRLILTESAESSKEAERRLSAGETFDKVAGDLSIHASRSRGGLLKPLPRGRGGLDPKVDEEVGRLQPNQVSPIIETASGYYIIQLVEVSPSQTQDLDAARPVLFDKLYQKKRRERLNACLEALLDNRPVVLFDTPTSG